MSEVHNMLEKPAAEKRVSEDHYVVAVGASAGGLEAIHEFFDYMPESTNSSFVIIQHLSPDYKSLLVDLVSKHTHMKVREAANDVEVERNCIYVIPNNKLITIKGNKLKLVEKTNAKVPNNAVDVFLYSLALEKRDLAIAVILSGTGTDGTKGIEAIKEAGGLVIVQDPTTAKFDGMPNSAIQSGNIDYIMPPAHMPEEILNYIHEPSSQTSKNGTIDDKVLEEIFQLIQKEAGNDFNYYKTPTIVRRITRRMLRGNFKSVESYMDFLRVNPAECRQLGKEFLIGVTKFFRDKEAFDVLAKEVIPEIINRKVSGDPVKLWVSACSTGEEAYSLAILLNEEAERQDKTLDIKVFATDIDEANVEIASKACYPVSIKKDIRDDLLEKYFSLKGGTYSVLPRLRKQIVFAKHNILKDPPFIKNDLVSCRNMLIYMNSVLQHRVYNTLLFATNKDGYLFFGSSENPSFSDNVVEINGRWKIYKKTTETKLGNHYVSDLFDRRRPTADKTIRTPLEGNAKRQKALWDEFRKVLTDDLCYAAFYIDQSFEIKEAVGNYENILTLPKRNLQLNLLRMVPAEVSTLLNNEIKNSWKTKRPVKLKDIRIKKPSGLTSIGVLIKPPNDPVHHYTMVVIRENDPLGEDDDKSEIKIINSDIRTDEYVQALENELNETKSNLQIAIEDLETANEELQSSNEELLSANEELQSSNEELQSLNEELHTLNTEHQLKIRELIELNDDLNNYFRSTDIGQVFLDKELKIRKFNPASAKMINFIESDLGRPMAHISTNIRYDNLQYDIEEVIRSNHTVEKEVQLVNGRNLLMRILPYITRDKESNGVIISFVDITTVTNLNNIIRGVFNSSPSSIFAFRTKRDTYYNILDFTVETVNYAATSLLGVSAEELAGKSLKQDIPVLCVNGMFDQYQQVVQLDKMLHTDFFMEASSRWYEVTAVKMMDGFVATFTDVTEKKVAEQRLKKNYVELISVKENLKKLNIDLENKVLERTRELSASEERFRLVARATNDALWDWDFVNNQVWWSDAFYVMFGYSQSGEFGRDSWRSRIHPDDRQDVEDSLTRVINHQKSQWTKEYRFMREDGSYANILDRGYILHDEYGTPYRMLGSMMDLTILKRAEREIANNIAQRKFLVESMPLIVWTADAEGQVNFVNQQFENYTGLSFNEALNSGWKRIIHEDDRETLNNLWVHAVDEKNDFQTEVKLKVRDGSYRWNLLRARARKDESDNVINWVVTTVDINEQKVMNEILEQKVAQRTLELQEINRALEASNNDLQQFASVASHDLQEPLRKIHMFSKLIRDRHSAELSNGAGLYLDKIMQASQRMKSMIKNVLNFSRLSAERNLFVVTNIKGILDELLEDFEITIREKQAHIHVGKFPDMELIPEQIRQVFLNLLSNALKFSKPDEPPVVTIDSKRVAERSFSSPEDPAGPYCKILVMDNGIGFDEKFKDNIFVLFHRLHSKDKYEGTGIGLAITKKIIEKHNGIITASGNPGEGAVFEIILPLKQESELYL